MFQFTKIPKNNFIYNTTKPPLNDSVIRSILLLYWHEAAVVARSELESIWRCKLEKSKKTDIDIVKKNQKYYPNPDPRLRITALGSPAPPISPQFGTRRERLEHLQNTKNATLSSTNREATNQRQHGPKRHHNLILNL